MILTQNELSAIIVCIDYTLDGIKDLDNENSDQMRTNMFKLRERILDGLKEGLNDSRAGRKEEGGERYNWGIPE